MIGRAGSGLKLHHGLLFIESHLRLPWTSIGGHKS